MLFSILLSVMKHAPGYTSFFHFSHTFDYILKINSWEWNFFLPFEVYYTKCQVERQILYPHFIGGQTEEQRFALTYLRVHSKPVEEPGAPMVACAFLASGVENRPAHPALLWALFTTLA